MWQCISYISCIVSLCDCKRSHGHRSKSPNYQTHSVILYIRCSEESHSDSTVGLF
nr:MAG TPA: hypothetical protein [Caudoviricetes sp.]